MNLVIKDRRPDCKTEPLSIMQTNHHFSIRAIKAAEKIKQHIDEHSPLEWINAATFAREVQVKREEIQKCFYAKYGKKISEYQQKKKIAIACCMLSEGELTKKEIAARCGYGNQNYFSYAFKKHTKMSPTEWELKHQNGNGGG